MCLLSHNKLGGLGDKNVLFVYLLIPQIISSIASIKCELDGRTTELLIKSTV